MHGAPGTPGAPGAGRAASAPRWVRAATEWMPQRLRAEPAGHSRDAGCVRMRRVKASYPQHIGRRAPKGADAPGRVAPVPLGYWEMQHYAQLCAALGRRRTRADAQMAQKASGRADGAEGERTRTPKPPRSVHFRLEIGRTPRRDRSQTASRSVRFRLEIGRTSPGGADQPADAKRPPNQYASTNRRAAAQTFLLLFDDFTTKHILITTLHRRIPIILTIHIILGVNASQ